MTRLNLHEQFPAAANENISWTLEVKTRSREELIHLSTFLAKMFKPGFFYDIDNPPVIALVVRAAAENR